MIERDFDLRLASGGYPIQIKICAEYRDMVPKATACLSGTWPEAVRYQVTCTWQIGRESRDHSYRVPVFCTDLNLFCSMHFPIFNSSVGGFGTLCFRTAWQSRLSIMIRKRQSLKTIKFLGIPCVNWWSAAGWETHWPIYGIEQMKLIDKLDKIHISEKLIN